MNPSPAQEIYALMTEPPECLLLAAAAGLLLLLTGILVGFTLGGLIASHEGPHKGGE